MNSTVKLFVNSFSCLLPTILAAQQSSPPATQTPQRDPQAIALLQQTVAAMASSIPTDSSATGAVTIVEGSTTQNGSIQILTRGTSQTAETLTLPDGQRAIVYSNGEAKEINGASSTSPPLELIVTDQCPDFPLPLLLSSLSTSDQAIHYVGAETLDGKSVQHIQVWNTFSSNPALQNIAPFSTKDIWLDAISGLPLKIAYSRRAGSGAVPTIPVEVTYSNYTKVNGILYPFQIDKSLNGTPWMTITISIVSFSTGLTDSHFQVE